MTQHQDLEVTQPDGSAVQVDLATGMDGGDRHAAAPPPLTAAQAAALGTDPCWDADMSPAPGAAGARNSPTLPTLPGSWGTSVRAARPSSPAAGPPTSPPPA
jgi:hypothetical protein